jgi:hypothetical protein
MKDYQESQDLSQNQGVIRPLKKIEEAQDKTKDDKD